MTTPKYSSISEFYDGKSVFVTGSTGFLGKVIVEKLLRSCEGIENVYLLVRPKKNKTADDRLNSFIKSPAFDLIKEKDPKILNKIVLIEGDIAAIELGISKADQELLCETVSVVINSAATVNFDEVLKIAVFTNLRSLRELIRLSRNIKHLEVKSNKNLIKKVHVSEYPTCDVKDQNDVSPLVRFGSIFSRVCNDKLVICLPVFNASSLER